MHIDMNAFFASCEQARRPELRGKPIVVGADETRSVVSAASYEARQFGVHSAMPIFKAKELCAELIFLPVDMQYYSEVSQRIFKLLQNYAYKIEKAGLDEAFIDAQPALTIYSSAREMARLIIADVFETEHIKCCVGIGRSKSVAKLASGLAKPSNKKGEQTGFSSTDGILEIAPEKTEEFLAGLQVRQLWGVGPKTAQKLNGIGIFRVEQIFEAPQSVLTKLLGEKASEHVLQLASGADFEDVDRFEKPPKSISREVTLRQDTSNLDTLSDALDPLIEDVLAKLRKQGLEAATISLIAKTERHIRHTLSATLTGPERTEFVIIKRTKQLLKDHLKESNEKVRLIGFSANNLAEKTIRSAQIDLLADEKQTQFNQRFSLAQAINSRLGRTEES